MKQQLDKRSKQLRHMIIDGLEGGKRGHLGAAMSVIDILRVLYDDVLHHDPKKPSLPSRDRFILSKGHGCLALYAVLADAGYFSKKEMQSFCHIDGLLGGHPEHTIPGVEFSTGSLGHGMSVGVGMALAARLKRKRHRVFVLAGDGESNEGSVWEAALSASKHALGNFTVIVDYNHMQSYDSTKNVIDLDPLDEKWNSFGFATHVVNGHDIEALRDVFGGLSIRSSKPHAVICHTIKGKGVTYAEGVPSWHHRRGLGASDIKKLHQSVKEYA